MAGRRGPQCHVLDTLPDSISYGMVLVIRDFPGNPVQIKANQPTHLAGRGI